MEHNYQPGQILYIKCKSGNEYLIFLKNVIENAIYAFGTWCITDNTLYKDTVLVCQTNDVDTKRLSTNNEIDEFKRKFGLDTIQQYIEACLNDKPTIRTYDDLISHNIEIKEGWWIDDVSSIIHIKDLGRNGVYEQNVALTEKVAKSMLAMSIISQLMPYYGGEITDEEWLSDTLKFCLVAGRDPNAALPKVIRTSNFSVRTYLAFHTPEQRDEFLKYNEQLVKDYLMID